MATADGRIYKPRNRCACGRPIDRSAMRCKSCNIRHQRATGTGLWTPEAQAKSAAAKRGRKEAPEATARRVAANPRNFRLDEPTLRRLYCDEQLTRREIARRKGCEPSTVTRAMRRFGIPFRTPSEQGMLRGVRLDAAMVLRLYCDDCLSLLETARRVGCSLDKVARFLRRKGIPIRPRKGQFRRRLHEVTLRRLYCDEGLTLRATARILGCDRDTLIRFMQRKAIPRRTQPEQLRLWFVRQTRMPESAAPGDRLRRADPFHWEAVPVREATVRLGRLRKCDPAHREAIRRSWTPKRRAILAEQSRARRQDPAYRERENARLRALSRRETKPWAAQTLQRLRRDPAFEAHRKERQLAAVREGWRTGRLGLKGKVPFTRRDGTTVLLGSRAEAIVALWLDKLEIRWDLPPHPLLIPPSRSYWPDLLLVGSGLYLEVKGGRDWAKGEENRNPGRLPNVYAAQAAGLPVHLLEVAYTCPKLCPDLALAAQAATTLDGRPLGQVISELIFENRTSSSAPSSGGRLGPREVP